MQTINEDIKNGTFRRVYLLYGDEDYLKLQYKNKLLRALVTEGVIRRAMESAAERGSGVAAIPVTDTIKRVDSDGRALETLNRDELRAMQTPQAFRLALLRQAHEKAEKDGFLGTDDAALLEHAGLPVYLTLGDPENLKLTTPADLALGEAILTLRREKEALS